MAFRITPSLGPDVDQVEQQFYWDSNNPATVSYKLGTKVVDNEGRDRLFLKAGGAIAADTQIDIDDENYEATTGGTSGWYTKAAVAEGDLFHAVRGTAV